MAGGGMYDRWAGGFFRYSTTRDWTIPHYEKMLEDNAGLADLYLRAGYLLADDELTQVGVDVFRWLFSTMCDPGTGCFAGSQDADKEDEYYGKNLEERAALPTPHVDRTIYAGWNALTVCSLATRYRILDVSGDIDAARRAYEFATRAVLPRHFWSDAHAQGALNLLGDLTSAIQAAVDLADIADDPSYLADAKRFADILIADLEERQGGFLDIKPDPDGIGALARSKKEIGGNAEASIAMIRLSSRCGDRRYRDAAERALGAFAGSYEPWSFFAAPYARAVEAALEPDMRVVISGLPGDDRVKSLRRAVWLAPCETLTCQIVAPESSSEYPADPGGAPLAYVCVGTTCSAPVKSEAELSKLLRAPNAPRRSQPS
jgi:uncharacterized protein YyaL (SSP411 family)